MTRPQQQQSENATMRRGWNALASEDAMHAIATRREPWSAEEFFATGRAVADDVTAWVRQATTLPGQQRMLEIGCGLGRLTIHFARHFDHVDGVDVSDDMITQARKRKLPPNVHLAITSGSDLRPFEDETFALVVSFLVFQHIPSETVIEDYLREIARVLRPDGAAVLQFDSRPEHWGLRVYKSLPDALLPREHRRHLRRYRRDPARLASMMQAAGLKIVAERGRRTADHVFLLLKPRTGSST